MKKNRLKIKRNKLKLTTLAFTLIELLAVIVILAIIALIAVPIILNIIDSSKNSANQRSVELYGSAVENAVAKAQLNGEDINPGELSREFLDKVQYDGSRVSCTTNKLYTNGEIYLVGCKIEGDIKEYTYGIKQNICELFEGNSKEVGAKYICLLDKERIFYVLENDEKSDKITLLMEQNYVDEEIGNTLAWCTDGGTDNTICKNITSKEEGTYLKHIQEQLGNDVTVDLPTHKQMTAVGCTYSGANCPTWTYDYLNGTAHPVSGANGYWTSTLDSPSAWYIFYHGTVYSHLVGDCRYGIRPVITLSKSDLS